MLLCPFFTLLDLSTLIQTVAKWTLKELLWPTIVMYSQDAVFIQDTVQNLLFHTRWGICMLPQCIKLFDYYWRCSLMEMEADSEQCTNYEETIKTILLLKYQTIFTSKCQCWFVVNRENHSMWCATWEKKVLQSKELENELTLINCVLKLLFNAWIKTNITLGFKE